VSMCHHCGRPRFGLLSQTCTSGEACELTARITELQAALAAQTKLASQLASVVLEHVREDYSYGPRLRELASEVLKGCG